MPDHAVDFDWDGFWDRFGDYSTSVPGTVYRQRLIFEQLGALGAEDRLLDIGCGLGELFEALHRAYPDTQLRAMDYAPSAVEATRLRVPNAEYFVRDLLVKEAVPDHLRAWATHATCSEVLEHVDDPIELMENARDYLAPGCRLVVTVPAGPRTSFDRAIGHVRHFTPGMLELVLTRAGFHVELVERAGFPFHNLYKLMIMVRGRQLMTDIEQSEQAGELSPAVKLATSVFNRAFKANLDRSPFGWQLVARASVPA